MKPWSAHYPVRPQELRATPRVLVGLFRSPAQRLLSGFHHFEGGRADSMIAPGMELSHRAAMQREARGDPARYARWPGIAGCATKMLLGAACASTRQIHVLDASRAALIVQDSFAFVGLLEHYSTSICIFHSMFMSDSTPDAAELVNTHMGRLHRSWAQRHQEQGLAFMPLYNESALKGFVDVHDEVVYAAAAHRFWSDAKLTRCSL
jgi:hypothetical protein